MFPDAQFIDDLKYVMARATCLNCKRDRLEHTIHDDKCLFGPGYFEPSVPSRRNNVGT